jgi:hypothetical protein
MGNDNKQNLAAQRKTFGNLILPFDEDVFKEFIKALLGQPQSITKRFSGCFNIEIDDITNLHNLLEQRIKQQNRASNIQFTARIIFSDDSSIKLNSIEELETYNEVKPIVSTAIHLSWDYLVQFEDKKMPEKQNVQFSIVTSHYHNPFHIFDEEDEDSSIFYFEGGFIEFTIKHTARTWGADIEALMTNYTKSILKEENVFKKYIRRYHGRISLASGAILFLISLISTYWATWRFSNARLKEINSFIKAQPANQQAITAKINFIMLHMQTGDWSQFYFRIFTFLIIALILSIIFGVWTEQTVKKRAPSFLLLTNCSKTNKAKMLKKEAHSWRNFIVSVVANIIYGVISGYILVHFLS